MAEFRDVKASFGLGIFIFLFSFVCTMQIVRLGHNSGQAVSGSNAAGNIFVAIDHARLFLGSRMTEYGEKCQYIPKIGKYIAQPCKTFMEGGIIFFGLGK